MSVINVERTSPPVHQQDHKIDLPTPIQAKLHTVIRQNARAELTHRVAVAVAFGLLAIIGLIVADVLFELRSTPIRWAIWFSVLGGTVGAGCYFVFKPWRRNAKLIDAAWKIESYHPAMEERLTSSVQLLEEYSSQNSSPQLISALVTETSDGVGCVDAESIPTRSSRIPIAVATALATAFLLATALWPQSVLMSLGNLATPWSPYVAPTLSVTIVPGDVVIAEGESVSIEVIASDVLEHPRLEIIRGEEVVQSHLMVATSPKATEFTLTDVREDAVYRIHSDGLYSVPHAITVHPRPQLNAVSGQFKFPDYTRLDPLTIEQVVGPIEVPAGTDITLTTMSDGVADSGVIRWNSEPHEVIARKVPANDSPEAVQFEWTFKTEPATEMVGTLELRSEHGVSSVPHPIAIRALADSSPKIEMITPNLRQLRLRRDSRLPIRYRVIDDYGVSKSELMVVFGKKEPATRSCQAPEAQPNDPTSWIGATSLELADVPVDCQGVSLWLRIADNRPNEFGGPQVIESERILVTIDDHADSLGQQQILADHQNIQDSLEKAIGQIQEALAAAEALENIPKQAAKDPRLEADRSESRSDHIDTLRQQTLKSKQTLEQLANELRDESNLFHSKAPEIQQIADQEVAKALEIANQIPLADDQQQQEQLARDSQEQLAAAMDQLDGLKSDIEQQAEQLKHAAKLDQLASKQERLAQKAAEGEPDGKPEEKWRNRQEKIADDLQDLVTENPKARDEQLLQRADEAERLAKQAQQLAQQQRKLGEWMEEAQKADRQTDKLNQNLQDLIEDQKEELNREAKESGQRQNGEAEKTDKQANEKQQRMNEAAKAAQRGDLDQAAAKIQEQIADRAEQIQQQAEQLANKNNPEPKVKERAQQAAEQLQLAKQKASQAKQSLCEKCNGGSQNKPGSQTKPDAQNAKQDGSVAKPNGKDTEPDAKNAKADEQNVEPNGQNRAAQPQNRNRKQQQQQRQQGADRPKDAGQQKPAPKQEDAKIKRDQQDVARSLQQASQSLNQVCKSCRECASGKKSGSSPGSNRGSSKSGGSPKSESPSGAKQLANASDEAKQAAKSPSKEKAAQSAKNVAEQLKQLADKAAQKSGFSLRQQKGSPQGMGKPQGAGKKPGQNALSGQPSSDPSGVGNAAGDTKLTGQMLRGGSNSNWTRSRRKLGGGVLEDRESNVPEQYRGVVKRYFEELSRQQSSRGE